MPLQVKVWESMDTFSKKKRSWVMSQVKSAGNKSTEEKLLAMLREARITGWRRSYPVFGKPDFAFAYKKVAVFVDGCFWHGHPRKCRLPKSNRGYWMRKIARNVARDRLVTRTLTETGWRVIRVWEDRVENPSTLSRLLKALA